MPRADQRVTPKKVSGYYQEKIAAIELFLKIFKFERYVHVTLAAFAVMIIFALAITLLLRDNPNWGQIMVIFGSGGLISISIGRILIVMNKAWKILFDQV